MGEDGVALPGQVLPDSYFATRYATLRQSLGFPPGSEHLDDDDVAIHAWVCVKGEVTAVGRAHLIAADSDGAQAEHAGPDAITCPAFGPLAEVEGGGGFPASELLRPAFHIRQMGTLPEWRRQGQASRVLSSLEVGATEHWGCNSGWLQAREEAVPFYQSQGWNCFGEVYELPTIGPHFSMWKSFS